MRAEAKTAVCAVICSFYVRGPLRVLRGKRSEKQYTVFLCSLDPAARAAFTPSLNYVRRPSTQHRNLTRLFQEHTASEWIPVQSLRHRRLHPVVAAALDDAAMRSCFSL